jgi:arylsulfatase A
VPLLIHWRDHFEPKVSDHLVHFTDLLPTLIDLCSLKSPSSLELDGTSQAGEFDGRAFDRTAIEKRVTTQHFWQWNRELPRYSHNAAIREGNWKLVRPFVTRNIPTTDSDLPPLLFDLSSDPSESRDIANDHPEVVQRLNIALEAWCQSVESDRTRP